MNQEDQRITRILEAIQRIAAGDYSSRIDISPRFDEIDGISTGINMLSEEIESKIQEHEEEKRKLNLTIEQLEKAKSELSRSKEMFAQIFQTSPNSISISKLENGEFVMVNEGFEAITGYKSRELIGRSVFDLGLWYDESTRKELSIKLHKDGYCQNLETKFRIHDGRIVDGLISASLIRIDGRPHLLVVGRDITEIKQTQATIAATQKKYEDLIRSSPDGILMLDRSGRIQMANPAFARLANIPEDKITGIHFTDLKGVKQGNLKSYNRTMRNVLEGKSSAPLQMKFPQPDGMIRSIEVHVTPIWSDDEVTGIQAVVRDVSERIRAVEALSISEEQYRTSMDAMHDSMCVIDPELVITVANKTLKNAMKGMGLPDDIVGKQYLEAFPFLDASIIDEYKKVFLSGKASHKEEHYFIGEQERYTDTRLIPVHEGKLVSRVLTIVQDVTERKKAERVQQIMYNISNAVNLTKDLDELFSSIQKELGKIFDTRNFFIAFYNKEDDTLSLPFFIDEKDSFESFPAKKTLTGYMIRNDQPLLMKNDEIEELVEKGILENVGSPSKIWLGVTLKIRDEIIGALVVQNYEDENAYSERDLEMLKFVSTQIGLSIETKKAYEDVRIEKAYFEQLFEGSPETIVLTDNDGVLMRVNSEFQRLFGYTPEESIGKNINNLIVPETHLDEAVGIFRRVAREEKILIETIRKHKDGKPIHVSVLGTPVEIEGGQVAVYGIYRDITDRKNAEIALRESQDKLSNILDSSPDAITVSDLRGNITECNQAALKLFECDSEEDLIGVNTNNFINPEDRKKGTDTLKSVLRRGHVRNVEFELVTEKGKQIYIDLSASLLLDNNDRPIGIVSVSQDISARKAYEKELERARDKAEESDRLKSAFLANMSHEIRTPMNAILGFSELLKSDDLSRESREEYLKIINNKGNELMLIINDIIDISKIEAGDIKIMKSELKVNEFLKETKDRINEEKALMNKDHIQLRLNIPENSYPVVFSDEARLRQIMYNLVSNALKFTHQGYVEIGYTMESKNVQFYVKDTGIGIAEDKREIVFDRFRQVDETINSEFGGTGLGLSISKNLVNMLGGELWMESEANQGSTFYFNIPLHANQITAEEDIRGAGPDPEKDLIVDLKGKKILVAEDDASNYLFLESYLKRTRSEIIWAKDGQQLIEIFRTEPALDLILMDIRMPSINGIDATRIIRETNGDIPIIALTAYAFADNREESINAGCNDYLAKPVKIEQLTETLTKYLK